ncbi:MAG: UbiA-like polyprenyltransferase [Gemmatimonadota bacterium]|jgi:4-hydroxybenzoate polyprenyltransferase|nr:4-hydroxybenzoate octaprenyltransferase [Gemmatimonadota bacterium]MDP6460558.1 UbiA-like polyprenyltransferase [Gemmatimonadota bacterium]MDP6529688.1 UbiA-like polyprenyltransferase [Gemmatimonadota bacterium]MDP6802475.1 UbiA-like polyprenyltransferase [Gemmatimonadota bacterium]MDP7030968.1 UbiA-like polyprenyltransferase [Gemmatimonadota bacterium]
MAGVRTLLSFVKFEHTLFSLPVIVAGAVLASGGVPEGAVLAWVLVAGTGARTVAMALNRLIDREIDARNPRTASREIPAGRMSTLGGWGVAIAGLVLYFGALAFLPPLCLALSPVPLMVFVIYPLMKRFTPLAHFGVGAGLALGPLGAWVAVTGTLVPWGPAHTLAVFTLLWVAGFDVIYATLDEDFDRAEGLRSLPASLGRTRALRAARGVHVAAFVALALVAAPAMPGAGSWFLLAAVGAMLVAEHVLAARVDLSFFRINAALGFVVLAFVWSILPAG